MKSLKRFLILNLILIPMTFAETIRLSVPFQNITLPPNGRLEAPYNFAGNPIIFCYTTDEFQQAAIAWTYRQLPVPGVTPITLVTSTEFEGQLADNPGVITMQNNMSQSILVNCDYGFLNHHNHE